MSYNGLSKILHWVSALLILGLLSAGFYMHALSFSPFKLQLYGLHKSFGILVLILAVLRLLWRFACPPPKAISGHQRWEKKLSKLVHIILYFVLFAMPLSGWLMSSAGGFPAGFFGLFELPALSGKDESLLKLMKNSHEILAFVIVGVVGLHMAGAFKHHIIDRDETLKRMTVPRLGLGAGLLLGVVLGGLLILPLLIHEFYKPSQALRPLIVVAKQEVVPTVGDEGAWVIQPEKSHIGFEVLQYGTAFTGEFEGFDGDIVFDPEDLEGSVVDITIDITSIRTGSDDRDEQARSGEWFDVAMFPQARFVARNFESVEPNRYVAYGDLTIREVTLPVDLSFLLEIDNLGDGQSRAKVSAELSLDRLGFGVGQGQWQSTEAIGNAIKINITLEALRGGGHVH